MRDIDDLTADTVAGAEQIPHPDEPTTKVELSISKERARMAKGVNRKRPTYAVTFAFIGWASVAVSCQALIAASREAIAADSGKTKPADNTVASGQTTWTADDVAAAEAQCGRLAALAGLKYTVQPPMKQGHCGDAAPVRLTAVGSHSLQLVPAVIANCRIAEGVHKWVDNVVQPAARALFGQEVVRLVGVSSFVCRNRNGAAVGPVSEHAYANAFDVTSFSLSDGRIISVEQWTLSTTHASTRNEKDKSPNRGAAALPKVVEKVQDDNVDAQTQFIQRIHHEACRMFGTVLGPEANEAHRQHLHLDMKVRKGRAYCQ